MADSFVAVLSGPVTFLSQVETVCKQAGCTRAPQARQHNHQLPDYPNPPSDSDTSRPEVGWYAVIVDHPDRLPTGRLAALGWQLRSHYRTPAPRRYTLDPFVAQMVDEHVEQLLRAKGVL